MFGLGVLPAAVLGIGMVVLPQSLRWLMNWSLGDSAREVLKRIRETGNVEGELSAIGRTLGEESEGGGKSFLSHG